MCTWNNKRRIDMLEYTISEQPDKSSENKGVEPDETTKEEPSVARLLEFLRHIHV